MTLLDTPTAGAGQRRDWATGGSGVALFLLWLIPPVRASTFAACAVAATATLLLSALAVILDRRDPAPGPSAPPWWSAGTAILIAAGAAWAARDGGQAALTVALVSVVAASPAVVIASRAIALLVARREARQIGATLPSARVLDSAAEIDALVIDKDRTVTTGSMQITTVEPVEPEHYNNLLFFAGALARSAGSPAAVALARRSGRGRITGFRELAGDGMAGAVDRHPVRVGRPAWIGLASPDRRGLTVGVEVDNRALGLITVEDVVRPAARDGVAQLCELATVTLVADGSTVDTSELADRVAIDAWVAEAGAAARTQVVTSKQEHGHRVCFIGPNTPQNLDALNASDIALTDLVADAPRRPQDVVLEPFDLESITRAVPLVVQMRQRFRSLQSMAGGLSLACTAIAASGILTIYTAAALSAAVAAAVAGAALWSFRSASTS